MSLLDELVAAAEQRARRDARRRPLRSLRAEVAALPPARHFAARLRYADRLALIAELKRASPSAGRFGDPLAGPDAVERLAHRYAAAGAACLSVLTEPTRFAGLDADLASAAAAGIPVLRKDFATTTYAVWQARALGADAVLLIARALAADRLRALLATADEAGLDALVEVHSRAELRRALGVGATLVGVNARDLARLKIDRGGALDLLAEARDSGATLVAESGLRSPADLEAAAEAGAHGALVGTSLLRSRDPAAAAAALVRSAPRRSVAFRPPPPPPAAAVKVCGIRTERGVRAAVAAGADLAGFVLATDRRRTVTPERAGELAGGLRGGPRPVLVLHHPSRAEAATAMARAGVHRIQVAGFDAPPDWITSVGAGELIGVVHAGEPLAALLAAEAWYRGGATRVLLEGAAAETGGGGGRGAPLRLARRLGRLLPVGIAGGLSAANVGAAVRAARPALVDASSGLEERGQSEPARIGAFVRAARRTGLERVDARGRFGRFGGRYVPETLIPALDELAAGWREARRDRSFVAELDRLLRTYVGRPTPLFEVPGSAPRLLLKREDLAHTGAHKINNALGQGLLAARMGKRRVIAETGAGQHGVATATVAALLGLECVVYMGTTDIERQAPNVSRMRLLGADLRPVTSGNGTLRDALNEALRDWVASVGETAYILGSAAGPHPYPELVATLQSVIGREARRQVLEAAGRLPDAALACVGGGSNAIGLFRPFLDGGVRLIGVEAGGRGDRLGDNAASLGLGRPGVLHGAFTMLTQTDDGQVVEPHSVSAGLDYPGVGPQLAALAAAGRLEVRRASDADALDALRWLAGTTGIVPALEPAHAIAVARSLGGELPGDALVLVNLSGRGDKDLDIVERQAVGAATAALPA